MSKHRVCAYTSFSYVDLPRARILAQTLRQAHPDWDLCAVIVDEPPPALDAARVLTEFDHVVEAPSLTLARFRSWIFKHNSFEACAAVKGQALVELLQAGYEKVIYLDPNIAIFSGLHDILKRLTTASVVLTPNQCEPSKTGVKIAEPELASLRLGVYNLGFIAVRNNATGRRFADWWAENLYRACYDAVENGIFIDQRYCDLIPGLFDEVFIERDPGYNVGSWNLSRRALRFDGGQLLVNQSPLAFFNFAAYQERHVEVSEQYNGENVEVFEVLRWYERTLVRQESISTSMGQWAYGRFSNGETIPRSVRLLYRSRSDLMAYFDDPFEVHGDSFYKWLKSQPSFSKWLKD